MSYWVYLEDRGGEGIISFDEPIKARGGTYAIGNTFAELNVTYNYGKIIRQVLHQDGLRFLHERPASDTILHLKRAISRLKDDVNKDDYWEPTEGNVKVALQALLDFATRRPDGVWRVS